MSSADDILFEPIVTVPEWFRLAKDMADYIRNVGSKVKPMASLYSINRVPPNGALDLLRMMELYHVYQQDRFFLVISKKHTTLIESFPFDGQLQKFLYEKGKAPLLSNYRQLSIRDMNLVLNTYTRHYVFANEADARAYMKSL